jgi:hypothetical protein
MTKEEPEEEEPKKKLVFRKPDFENARRELPERLKVMEKFARDMEKAQRVSSKTWYRHFDI